MKKNTWISVVATLVLVLGLSFLCSKFLLPLLEFKTYSETFCLTDQITDEMDVYDIAKLYRDSNSTVAVTVVGHNTELNAEQMSLGSGVVIASKGYETTSLSENIVASMGSYIVTNYHVIENYFDDAFTRIQISIIIEDESEYSCELLWANKNLDVAVLYCDDLNADYIRMADRWVNCDTKVRLDYEEVFTIGTPLQIDYLNRLTFGNIASNNNYVFSTSTTIYPTRINGVLSYNKYSGIAGVTVLDNVYEDVIDIAVGITNGNSGGGLFDSNGVLVGLTTLGANVESTGGNQMNGAVPIYPVIEVLDKLIANNELGRNYRIYDLDELGIVGFDSLEASQITTVGNYSYYYFDEELYDASNYSDDFNFISSGYYILQNSSSYSALSALSQGSVITSCQITGEESVEVVDRNDLLYFLLQIDDGDQVTFNYTLDGRSQSVLVQF